MKKYEKENRSIVNGYNAKFWRFFVEVGLNCAEEGEVFRFCQMCGGSIIRPDVVVTAAHCTPLDFVRYRDVTSESETKNDVIRLRRRVDHPEYNPDHPAPKNDIALFFLSRPIDSIPYKTIPLCKRSFAHHDITVIGMGKTGEEEGPYGSDVLQEVKVKEVFGDKCYIHELSVDISEYQISPQALIKALANTEVQICLNGDNKGSCFGDSGGPAFPVDGRGNAICLYGVVSYGSPMCTGEGVYTRVSAFSDWINSEIAKDQENLTM